MEFLVNHIQNHISDASGPELHTSWVWQASETLMLI